LKGSWFNAKQKNLAPVDPAVNTVIGGCVFPKALDSHCSSLAFAGFILWKVGEGIEVLYIVL